MQNQNSNSSNQSSASCLLPALIMISIGLALLLGAAGGAMLDDPRSQTQTTTYPKRSDDIPAPAPAPLNDVPNVQTFAVDPCDYPTAPVPNYEHGVGGVLPPCWSVWTREQQNAFLRSH